MNDLILKSVDELAPLIKNKTLSPVELTKAVLDHAEKVRTRLTHIWLFIEKKQ